MGGQRPALCADLPSSGPFLLASFSFFIGGGGGGGRAQTSCLTALTLHPVGQLGGGWETRQKTSRRSTPPLSLFIYLFLSVCPSVFLSVCSCLLYLVSLSGSPVLQQSSVISPCVLIKDQLCGCSLSCLIYTSCANRIDFKHGREIQNIKLSMLYSQSLVIMRKPPP